MKTTSWQFNYFTISQMFLEIKTDTCLFQVTGGGNYTVKSVLRN